MKDDLQARIDQLRNEAHDAVDEVSNALESGEDKQELDAGRKVEALARRYQEILDETEGKERDALDRTLGRRITDLRRSAQALTKRMAGQKAVRSVDAGFVPFLEHRAPPKSIMPSRQAPKLGAPKYAVGAEVDAWCGKCQDLRTHHIVAMVGELPKQVICQACRSRHGYRTTPARAKPVDNQPAQQTWNGVTTTTGLRSSSPAEREIARKKELQQKLIEELDAATIVRPFMPKERYKAGEIIQHAELGRGKIENVLRGSLLVRFRDGLRPVNLG